MLSFKLEMPSVNSWNGRWSGEEKSYFIIKRVSKSKEDDFDGKRFYYNFGDGWSACVVAEKIDSKEAQKRRKKSAGFCGYNWMVDEILTYGKIRSEEEKNK